MAPARLVPSHLWSAPPEAILLRGGSLALPVRKRRPAWSCENGREGPSPRVSKFTVTRIEQAPAKTLQDGNGEGLSWSGRRWDGRNTDTFRDYCNA